MSKLKLKKWPGGSMISRLFFLAVLLAVMAAAGLTGCGEAEEAADTDTTVGEAVPNEATGADDAGTAEAAEGQAVDDQDQRSGSQLSAEDEEDAADMAGAYLVAQTDFTSDQFDWAVLSVVEDDEGEIWAKVRAAPKDGESIETYYIYVRLPVGWDMWNVYGMGTDAEPIDEKNMPEEIQGKL